MLANGSRPGRLFGLAAALMLGGWVLLALRPDWLAEPLHYVAGFLALFAVACLSLVRWRGARGRSWGWAIFLVGAAVRVLVLLLHPPDLSQDIARYAWDGHLLVRGIHPFAHAPEDPALAPLRTEFFADISYKEIPTIYPPVAQILFAAAGWLAPGTFALRALLVGCDLAVLLLLWRLLRRARLPEGRLLVYAWSPLPVAEVASSGHVEPLGILLLLLAALALDQHRRLLAGAAWAGAVLTKLAPLVLAPLLWRRGGGRALAGAAAAGGALLLPFVSTDAHLLTAGGEYSSRWRANDFLFAWLEAICGWLGGAAAVEALVAPATAVLGAGAGEWVARMATPAGAARLVAAATVALYAAARGLRPGPPGGVGFLQDVARVVVLAALLAPTLHPWYLLWLLPLLTFALAPAWILLSGTVVLSYVDLAAGRDALQGPSLMAWLEYAPALALAVVLARRRGGGLLAGGDVDGHPR